MIVLPPPSAVPRINRRHPLAQGLVALYLPGRSPFVAIDMSSTNYGRGTTMGGNIFTMRGNPLLSTITCSTTATSNTLTCTTDPTVNFFVGEEIFDSSVTSNFPRTVWAAVEIIGTTSTLPHPIVSLGNTFTNMPSCQNSGTALWSQNGQ